MSRRTFLKVTGAGSAAVTLTAGAAGFAEPAVWAPSIGQSSAGAPEVVVVGAGAFGGWTALNLRELGHSVTLVANRVTGRATEAGLEALFALKAGTF